MSSEGSEQDRYKAKRNRLTLAAAAIGVAMIALSWFGAQYRDRKRQEGASMPMAVTKPATPAPASLRVDGLPPDATVSVDSNAISPETFRAAPGRD